MTPANENVPQASAPVSRPVIEAAWVLALLGMWIAAVVLAGAL